ncbi:otoferlin isoform X2 [Nilaparvata lugens]|uniref:otoferlin isoform X2 n=1 Tax=Nilaparvata lugens TaxID=108931 RepID=UPI00193E0B93|nr:otoferlin isoform X2 [Nilaparvata lugens]
MKNRKLYNICISVLEAKYLAWIDIKTYVEIEIDGKKKCTKVKECSDRPFYNEYFVFEVQKSLLDLMSTDIEISMYKPRANFRKKKVLASIKLDIGTIWNKKDHQIYHEWLTLRHRAKEKGFLQCDIRILSADSEPMHHLSPFGRSQLPQKKHDIDEVISVAVYFLRIYRGGDMYNFNQSKKHSKISVSITFCGITMKTSDQRDTVNPVWNEEFKIVSPFPPAHYKLKLDLVINDKEVSSVSILMDELSCTHDKHKGFLPTFGPAHKYFYSSHNSYLGYIIFSLETIEMRDAREDSESSVSKRLKISGLVEEKHFGFQYFSCYCVIYEVSMLNKHLCSEQELTISLEFGREGLVEQNETNVTKPLAAEVSDGIYCWLPLENQKPCLYVKDFLPDTRWRLFMTNSLQRVCENLSIITTEASKINKANKFKKIYNDTKYLLDVLKKFARDPQDSLPSIIVNIWKHNKRIYTGRIKPENVIYANTPHFCGSSCGQLKTFFLDELGSHQNGRKNRAKMAACIWMGVHCDNVHWTQSLPNGFSYCSFLQPGSFLERHSAFSISGTRNSRSTVSSSITEVPSCVKYQDSFDCICRVYIEQAYYEDQSLFDTPSHNSVRVVFQNRSTETQEVYGMQQIMWSESLSTAPVKFYGERSYFVNHPTTIVLEVWQKRKKVSLVGNVCLGVKLRSATPSIESMDLECHDIVLESARVGKLFLSAELIEVDEERENYFSELERTKFPSTSTAMYRLEVYFWGVRDLKLQPAKVNTSLRITIGKYSISSPPLISHRGFTHFSKQELVIEDMILPKSKQISPMMIINLIDTVEEESVKYTACCSINSIHDKFDYCPITPHDWRKVQNVDKHDFVSLRQSFNYTEFTDNLRKKSFLENIKLRPPALLIDILWLLKQGFFYVLYSVKMIFSKYQMLDNNAKWMNSENLAEPAMRVRKEKNDWWTKYFNSKKTVENVNNHSNEDRVITVIPKKKQPLKLEFYTGELENEFDGFTDCLKVFKLAQSETDESPENTTFCKVKAAVVLYEVPSPDQELLTRNGRPLNDTNHVLSSHVVPSNRFTPVHPFSSHSPVLWSSPPLSTSSLPPTPQQRLLLRVYIVQAYNLFAKHGQSLNPYISASVSSASLERFATNLYDQSNPCFGLSFELIAELPKDYELTVKVMNFVRFGKNELIGETKVDLENRFYTRHRARCGLQTIYDTKGYNSWRDQFKPSEILESLCEDNDLPPPMFMPHSIVVAGNEFIFPPFAKDMKEAMSLNLLHRWEEIPIVGCKLVREHVETRPLYKPQCPGIIQGYIEMWVDMFDMSKPHPLSPLMDITPREPQAYELRVIIYKTCKVYLVDNTISVGYKHSDIFVKGWMLGKADAQCTDVHFKSITGDGDFNWRFIFPFKYFTAEGCCITLNADMQTSASKKRNQLTKIPPRIYLQVCDKERLLADQFIGLLSLDLRHMIKGASRWWLCQSYVDESPKNTLNLFQERKTRGWWPFYGSQRFRQKNKITGYLEAEFHLVTYFEALRSPVGYGRNEPDGLPDPKRKIVRFTFWLLPCRVVLHMIGLNKLTILFFLAISGVILFVLLGVYAIPSTVVQRMIGGN